MRFVFGDVVLPRAAFCQDAIIRGVGLDDIVVELATPKADVNIQGVVVFDGISDDIGGTSITTHTETATHNVPRNGIVFEWLRSVTDHVEVILASAGKRTLAGQTSSDALQMARRGAHRLVIRDGIAFPVVHFHIPGGMVVGENSVNIVLKSAGVEAVAHDDIRIATSLINHAGSVAGHDGVTVCTCSYV